MDIICIGMALVDSIIKGFDPRPVSASGYRAVSGSLNVGGEAVNEAMAAAKLGLKTGILCSLGEDDAGDMIIGFPSGGLQTNGFSLARRVVFDLCQYSWQDKLPGTNQTFGDALLAVHKSFLKPVAKLLERKIKISGMAHITGGGFPDNIPRVLPKAVNAEIDRASWEVPTIFKFIENQGKVDRDEMYRVFNMGIGFVVIIPKNQMTKATNILKAQHQPYHVIGVIRKGKGIVTYKN